MASQNTPKDASESYPTRSPAILWRETDGCIVLFHEDDGRAFALNETAAAVWKLCDGSRSAAEMAGLLGPGSDGPADAARADVAALLGELTRCGCLTAEQDRAPSSQPPPPVDASPSAWREAKVEEIAFGGCDCTGSGRGVMRNTECSTTSPKVQMSTV